MAVVLLIISSLLLILFLLYYFSRSKFDYWKKRNVPFLEPKTFFGNYKDYILMKVYPATITKAICKEFPDAPYVGVYYGTEPALVVKDLELIKLITTKDFYYFNGREVSDHNHNEIITQNIFFTQGERWKILRQNLTPLFSPKKLKDMFYLINKCATEFESVLDKEFLISPTMDVGHLMSRYTIDSVVLCSFGINSNVMGNDQELNPFMVISKKVLDTSLFSGIKLCGRTLWPRIFYALGLKMFSTEVNDFFGKLLTEVFQKREYKPSSRNDFIDLILSLYQNKFITGETINPFNKNDTEKIQMEVDNDFMIGQCVAFFAGGFETSATALCFVLYELAKHQDAQKRALADVDAYLLQHKNCVEYDVINEVPYLDACLDEALRLHPLLGVITRESMEQYTFPDGFIVKKGLRIHIPVSYLHYHPDNFSNPEKYEPERFLGERRKDIKDYTYYPFGVGPRICIGMRFAKLLVLTGLVTVLKKYSVKLTDDTPRKLHYDPKSIPAKPKEHIKLTFVRRS